MEGKGSSIYYQRAEILDKKQQQKQQAELKVINKAIEETRGFKLLAPDGQVYYDSDSQAASLILQFMSDAPHTWLFDFLTAHVKNKCLSLSCGEHHDQDHGVRLFISMISTGTGVYCLVFAGRLKSDNSGEWQLNLMMRFSVAVSASDKSGGGI